MNRSSAPLRWRQLRWVLCAAVVPVLWACNTRKLQAPSGGPAVAVQTKILQSQNHKLDLLFMIDDSDSMATLQTKLQARLPDFMQQLKNLPGGLPDLHVAVVSSSLGAGIFSDVTGCFYMTPPGDDSGNFQHKSGCGLNPNQNYITASQDGKSNNFTGTLESVFTCIAGLGQAGCGFEHQLESTRTALKKATNPSDPNNGGFLRSDAFLGIIMLTNEDDCSVPPDSRLFDPTVESINAQPPLGNLWSYRCNEFGHKCDQPLPHTGVGLPMTLTNCTSKENSDGPYHLTPVKDFEDFLLKDLNRTQDNLFVAVIGGPYDDATAKYVVQPRMAMLTTGAVEIQPEIAHSCMQNAGEYADPGVRLLKFVNDLGGVFVSICANDFGPSLMQIGTAISQKLQTQCVNGVVVEKSPGVPDCDVVLRTTTAGGNSDKSLEHCTAGPGTADQPCWQWGPDPGNKCMGNHVLQLCYDAGCAMPLMSNTQTVALVSCALATPSP